MTFIYSPALLLKLKIMNFLFVGLENLLTTALAYKGFLFFILLEEELGQASPPC